MLKHKSIRTSALLVALGNILVPLAHADAPDGGGMETCVNIDGRVECCPTEEEARTYPHLDYEKNCLPSGHIRTTGSVVDLVALAYTHDATDDRPSSRAAAGGCSSCGASPGASASGAVVVPLRRYHKFRDQTLPCSSFGPGVFSNFDTSLNWMPQYRNKGMGILYVPQTSGGQVTFQLQGDGTIYDRARRIKGVRMLDAAGAVTSAPAQAARVAVQTYDGATCTFEIVDAGNGLGNVTQYGRLVRFQNADGYGYSITYKTWTAEEIAQSPRRQFQIDAATDDTGRSYRFTYRPGQVGGVWAVSSIRTPAGQTVTYDYADDHLSAVHHPDGNDSTFAYGTHLDMVTVDIVDPAAGTGHDVKRVYATSNFSYAGYRQEEGLLYNQSSRLFRGLADGTGKLKLDVLPNLRLENSKIGWSDYMYVIEGDTLFQLDGSRLTQYAKAGWTKAEDPATGKLKLTGGFEDKFFVGTPDPSGDKAIYAGALIDYRTKSGEYVTQTTDANNFLQSRNYSDGTSETWTYTAGDQTTYSPPKNITGHTGRDGRKEEMTYDVHGNLLTKTEAVGTAQATTITYTYYPAGDPNQFLLKSETDANGHTTDYAYDANHRLAGKTLPPDVAGGPRATYRYAYDSAGRLSQTTDPVGRTVTYTYDALNRVVKRDYCGVSNEESVYGVGVDAARVIASKDRDDRWTAYRYDAQGRVVTTIGGIADKTQAVDPGFTGDPVFHDISRNTYLPGTDLKASCIRNGEKTEYKYDYRNRVIATTAYSGKVDENNRPVGLTTTTEYLDNKVFKTTDAYGRNTYYAYRASDGDRVREVAEAIPGGAGEPTSYEAVAALARRMAPNAAYIVTDYELDASGRQTAMVDGNGYRSETTYDAQGRPTVRKIAVGTPEEAKTETVYDTQGNVIEQRGARYFDVSDQGGYQKAETRMVYNGRNQLLERIEAPGTPEEGKTTYTYYLDGKQATQTDPNGHTVTRMERPLCGWALGTLDQAGHGTLTNTTVGGDVIHQAKVKDLKNLVTTTEHGLVIPQGLNEVDLDIPDANTLSESTSVYDSRHRPIATSVWSGPLKAVDRSDVPIWFNHQVQGRAKAQAAVPQGVTGQTTLYYYSEDLSASTVLHHAFGPDIDIQPVLAGLAASGRGVISEGSNASARATMAPTGEVSVQIMDGLGRTVTTVQLAAVAP